MEGRRFFTGDFEDLVHFVDEEIEFVVGQVAVGIEFLETSGGGLCGGVAEFSEVKDLADEAGEDIEEASIFEWVLGELFFEGRGREIGEEFVILAGDDLESGFGESGGVL